MRSVRWGSGLSGREISTVTVVAKFMQEPFSQIRNPILTSRRVPNLPLRRVIGSYNVGILQTTLNSSIAKEIPGC